MFLSLDARDRVVLRHTITNEIERIEQFQQHVIPHPSSSDDRDRLRAIIHTLDHWHDSFESGWFASIPPSMDRDPMFHIFRKLVYGDVCIAVYRHFDSALNAVRLTRNDYEATIRNAYGREVAGMRADSEWVAGELYKP